MAAANYSPPETALIKATRADFDRRDVVQPVHLVQYDDTLPVLAVDLYTGGQPWTRPTGADVNLRMDKKDGHYVYNPALGVSSDRATVYLAVTAQMTTGCGTFAPVVEVLAGGGVAGMAALRLEIDRNPVQDGMLESTDEYKTVQALADRLCSIYGVTLDSGYTANTAARGGVNVMGMILLIIAVILIIWITTVVLRPRGPRPPRRGGRGGSIGSNMFWYGMGRASRRPRRPPPPPPPPYGGFGPGPGGPRPGGPRPYGGPRPSGGFRAGGGFTSGGGAGRSRPSGGFGSSRPSGGGFRSGGGSTRGGGVGRHH